MQTNVEAIAHRGLCWGIVFHKHMSLDLLPFLYLLSIAFLLSYKWPGLLLSFLHVHTCINAQLLSTVGIWRAQREMNYLWRTA